MKWRETPDLDLDSDAREIRAEMARVRLLEFRAEAQRKAERHAVAMAKLSRRVPSKPVPVPVLILLALAAFLLICLAVS